MFFPRLMRLSAALIFACSPAFGAPLIAIDVDPDTPGIQTDLIVSVGQAFSADVVITGVDVADSLNAFELALGFDPSVLQATSAIDGDFLLDPVFNLEAQLDNLVGEISFSSVTLAPIGASGDGVLASLGFVALASGTSVLDLNDLLLSAPFGVPIEFGEVSGGAVSVTPEAGVPEPNILVIFALGLAVLVSVVRHGRAKQL